MQVFNLIIDIRTNTFSYKNCIHLSAWRLFSKVFFRFYMKKTDSWVLILQCDPVLFRWGFFYDEKWRPVINLLGNWHYSSFHWLLELLGCFCESRFRHPTLNLGLKEEMSTFMVSQELLNIPTFRRLSPYTVIIVNYV